MRSVSRQASPPLKKQRQQRHPRNLSVRAKWLRLGCPLEAVTGRTLRGLGGSSCPGPVASHVVSTWHSHMLESPRMRSVVWRGPRWPISADLAPEVSQFQSSGASSALASGRAVGEAGGLGPRLAILHFPQSCAPGGGLLPTASKSARLMPMWLQASLAGSSILRRWSFLDAAWVSAALKR